MKRGDNEPRVLLVEGRDEVLVLPELLELAGVAWIRGSEPVFIRDCEGIDQLLDPKSITAELKTSGVTAIGLIVDADGDITARWQRVQTLLATIHPDFPHALDPAGIVYDSNPRLGVWLMPDNLRAGMLETLLLAASDEPLREHARASMRAAKTLGAPFRDSHHDKALLHTWLAWQDPPGQQLPLATKSRTFNAAAPAILPFVAWFRRLYRL